MSNEYTYMNSPFRPMFENENDREINFEMDFSASVNCFNVDREQ